MIPDDVYKRVGDYFDVKDAKKWISENSDSLALLRIREKNDFLPETGINCESRDESGYALITMDDKIDTGLYGGVYYF